MSPASKRAREDLAAREVKALARGSGLNLVGAVVTQIGTFVTTLLLTHGLSKNDVGVFQKSFALYSILQIVALMGLGVGLTRYVAIYLADGDVGRLRGTVRAGVAVGFASSLVTAVVLFLVANPLGEGVYDDPGFVTPIRFVALALPPTVVTLAALSCTQGFRTMKPWASVQLILDPVLRVGFVSLALATDRGLQGVMAALVLTPVITSMVALVWLRLLVHRLEPAPRVYDVGELMRYSRWQWATNSVNQALLWVDSLILPLFVSNAEVGVYGVATRLVVLASFVMGPVNQAFAPRIADLTRRRQTAALSRTYRAAAGWMLRASLPFFTLLWVVPGPLLKIFGPGFAQGARVTAILAIGRIVDVATGPTGVMLNYAGYNRVALFDNVLALALNIGLNFALIPTYGIEGAAVAWTTSLLVVNVMRLFQVRRRLVSELPFDESTLRALAALAWSVLAALLVREAIDGNGFVELIAVTIVVFAVYTVFLVTLKLPEEDMLVLQDLSGVFRPRRAAKAASARRDGRPASRGAAAGPGPVGTSPPGGTNGSPAGGPGGSGGPGGRPKTGSRPRTGAGR
jgi:O-antigen/teichoic acid export membrane protein